MADASEVYEFARSERERVRIWAHTFMNRPVVSVHIFYREKGTGAWKPTRKGITLGRQYLAQLTHALCSLRDQFGAD
ncbi:MAG: hypothetical protein IPJ56_10625 [Gemmatimonadetes bacterium]|nr:hypothetical protein [Gemmatimonadota bacterium]